MGRARPPGRGQPLLVADDRRVEGVYLEIMASKDGRPETRPPLGVRYNLRRNPIELVRNMPAALRAGYPKEGAEDSAA